MAGCTSESLCPLARVSMRAHVRTPPSSSHNNVFKSAQARTGTQKYQSSLWHAVTIPGLVYLCAGEKYVIIFRSQMTLCGLEERQNQRKKERKKESANIIFMHDHH